MVNEIRGFNQKIVKKELTLLGTNKVPKHQAVRMLFAGQR